MPAEKIPGWIERLLLPKLSEISGDIKSLDVKIESLRNEAKTEIESLRNETKIGIDLKAWIIDLRQSIQGLTL